MPFNKRILVIDDSKAIHAFVKEALSKKPIEIVSIFDGQQGIEKLKEDQNFSLILLDWEMPVMDGPKTLQNLMNMKIKIPVSMMTSKSAYDDIMKMLALGAKEYIMKPFTKDILNEKIDALLAEQKAS